MSITLHTAHGDVKIELFIESTPKTCENFLALCAARYYNGCIWHRIIKGFIIQTGDPTGQGKGGTSIWGGKFEDEFKPYLKYDRPGLLGMANSGRPDTNTSQFFITCDTHGHLDNKFTLFGRVIHGMDVVEKIAREPVDEKYQPLNKSIIIESVTIHSNPIALREVLRERPFTPARTADFMSLQYPDDRKIEGETGLGRAINLHTEPPCIIDYQNILCLQDERTQISAVRPEDPDQTDKAGRRPSDYVRFQAQVSADFSFLLLHQYNFFTVLHLNTAKKYQQAIRIQGADPITSAQLVWSLGASYLCVGNVAGIFFVYDLQEGRKLLFSHKFHHAPVIKILVITACNSEDATDWLLLVYRDGAIFILSVQYLIEFIVSRQIALIDPVSDKFLLILPPFASVSLLCLVYSITASRATVLENADAPLTLEFLLTYATDAANTLFCIDRVSIKMKTPHHASRSASCSLDGNSQAPQATSRSSPSSPSTASAKSWWGIASELAKNIYGYASQAETRDGTMSLFDLGVKNLCRYPRDGLRQIESYFLPPYCKVWEKHQKIIAMVDNLGRVLLFDPFIGIILYIWKGYRDAVCQWLYHQDRVYLAIFSMKRSSYLDVWYLPCLPSSTMEMVPILIKSPELKQDEILVPSTPMALASTTGKENRCAARLYEQHSHCSQNTLFLLQCRNGQIRHLNLFDPVE